MRRSVRRPVVLAVTLLVTRPLTADRARKLVDAAQRVSTHIQE